MAHRRDGAKNLDGFADSSDALPPSKLSNGQPANFRELTVFTSTRPDSPPLTGPGKCPPHPLPTDLRPN